MTTNKRQLDEWNKWIQAGAPQWSNVDLSIEEKKAWVQEVLTQKRDQWATVIEYFVDIEVAKTATPDELIAGEYDLLQAEQHAQPTTMQF